MCCTVNILFDATFIYQISQLEIWIKAWNMKDRSLLCLPKILDPLFCSLRHRWRVRPAAGVSLVCRLPPRRGPRSVKSPKPPPPHIRPNSRRRLTPFEIQLFWSIPLHYTLIHYEIWRQYRGRTIKRRQISRDRREPLFSFLHCSTSSKLIKVGFLITKMKYFILQMKLHNDATQICTN